MEMVIRVARDGVDDKLGQTDCVSAQHAGNSRVYPWQLGGLLKLDSADFQGALM